jgi:hypothetical protein
LDEPLTILIAARDEEQSIAAAVKGLRAALPDAEVLVGDDGSRDGTASAAEEAGAIVLRLPRRGKGQALSAAERAAPPGAVLLVDADVRGDLRPLIARDNLSQGIAVAKFAARVGGGFGIAKRAARVLIRACAGFDAEEPLSGQRALSARARAAVFPLAPGFGAETRMTIDAVRAGFRVVEVPVNGVSHRSTGRGPRGFLHRGRQGIHVLRAAAARVIGLW